MTQPSADDVKVTSTDPRNSHYTFAEFQRAALRTEADPSNPDLQGRFYNLLPHIAVALNGNYPFEKKVYSVDSLKRAIYYGDTQALSMVQALELPFSTEAQNTRIKLETLYNRGLDIRVILVRFVHAFIGKLSELCELTEWVEHMADGDRTQAALCIKEEGGDNLWYSALLHDVHGDTMADAAASIIRKLSLRYPEKFNQSAALNRDTEAEQRALEAVVAGAGKTKTFCDTLESRQVRHTENLKELFGKELGEHLASPPSEDEDGLDVIEDTDPYPIPGQLVRLKSGGPDMTVVGSPKLETDDLWHVPVSYWADRLYYDTVPIAALEFDEGPTDEDCDIVDSDEDEDDLDYDEEDDVDPRVVFHGTSNDIALDLTPGEKADRFRRMVISLHSLMFPTRAPTRKMPIQRRKAALEFMDTYKL